MIIIIMYLLVKGEPLGGKGLREEELSLLTY